MIQARAKIKLDAKKVMAAAKRGNITSLGHAAGAIRLAARHSIKKSPKKSPAGTPPNTRKGRLRGAIKYAVSKSPPSAVIGPDAANAGTSGKAHEFGGKYKRERYDRRPFMLPALENVKPRLPKCWENSIRTTH
ncbi:MAG: hypothetical protein FWD61_01215 [Phycisphaerales bacterium]|nr:hypothetical protein [Phycisphaerales bacterium]